MLIFILIVIYILSAAWKLPETKKYAVTWKYRTVGMHIIDVMRYVIMYYTKITGYISYKMSMVLLYIWFAKKAVYDETIIYKPIQ